MLLMKASVVQVHVLLPVVWLTWQQNTQWSLKNKTLSESQALQKQETTEKELQMLFILSNLFVLFTPIETQM